MPGSCVQRPRTSETSPELLGARAALSHPPCNAQHACCRNMTQTPHTAMQTSKVYSLAVGGAYFTSSKKKPEHPPSCDCLGDDEGGEGDRGADRAKCLQNVW